MEHHYIFILDGVTSTGLTVESLHTNVEWIVEVLEGGTVKDLTINGNGSAHISKGGMASNTTVNAYGYLRDDGGDAYDTVINNHGSMVLLHGYAARTTINSGGTMTVFNDGKANSTTVSSGAFVFVDNGATVSNTTIMSTGRVTLSAGASANRTTIDSGGKLYISGGAKADSVTLLKGGGLIVSSGGTATNVTWIPFLTYQSIEEGAYVTYADTMSGVYYGEYGDLQSQAAYMNGKVVEDNHSMYVMKGGEAADITVGSATVFVSSGGVVNGATLNSMGFVRVSSGGAVNGATLNSQGYLIVSSGGTAANVLINSNGYLKVSSGGTATIVFTPVPMRDAWIESAEGATVQYLERDANVYCWNSETVLSKGNQMENLTLALPEYAAVYAGGRIEKATVKGYLYVSEGGIANSATIEEKGKFKVFSGGSASNTTVKSGGEFYVSNGGSADTTVLSGIMTVFDGASANRITIDKKYCTVYGVVNSTTVNSGGSLLVEPFGTANSTTVKSGGSLNFYHDAIVNGVIISSDARILTNGGKLTGKMTIMNGATVHVNSETIVDFDLTQTTAGATAALLNDLSKLNNVLNFTVTVDGTQSTGTYKLAEGAAGFGKTVTVTNTAGTELGVLTVNGDESDYVSFGGRKYALRLNNSTLSVTVVSDSASDKVFMGNVADGTKLISSGSSALGVNVNKNGTLQILTKGSVLNTMVNAGGKLIVSSGGSAKGVTIAKGGTATVLDDVVASNVVVNGGEFVVDSYGWAFQLKNGKTLVSSNTIVKNGGLLRIAGTAQVSGALIQAGGRAVVESDGLLAVAEVAAGTVSACDGAVVSRVSLKKGGRLKVDSGASAQTLYVSEGGVLTGVLHGASELRFYGGTLDLDITGVAPGNEFLVDDPTCANIITTDIYTYVCTLTVSDDQARGTYNLMEGVYDFDKTVTVKNALGEELGTLTVGENDVEIGNALYSLSMSGYDLVVSVERTDTAAPVVSNMKATPSWFTNQDVTVTADFTDNVGIAKKEYRFFNDDQTPWVEYPEEGVIVTENKTVYFKATDTSGNESEIVSFKVSFIDREPPKFTGILPNTTDPADSVTVTTHLYENGGIESVQYKVGDNPWQDYAFDGVTVTENTTVSFRAVDYAGNETEVSYDVTNIIGAAVKSPVRGDRDGNGISDVMFVWTGSNHAHGYWMNGSADWWSYSVGVDAAWDNLGSYDMNMDGKADAVMVGNVVTEAGKGAYIGFYNAGNDVDGWVNIGYLPNAEDIDWSNMVGNLTGTAGANSIVWYAPELYALGAWIDGTDTWVGISAGFGGPDWTLAGCGDFNGDGKDEVLMMLSGCMFYSVDIDGNFASLGASAWYNCEVRAIGDFSGDGKDDIVIFDKTSGGMYMLRDGNADSFDVIGQLDPGDWFIAGCGDYNADGKDDLLVRQNSTGMLGYYDGGDTSKWNVMGYGVDMQWTVIA